MTTPPVTTYPAVPAAQEPDRSGWLVAFGILELLIACAIFGFLALMLLGLLVSRNVPNQPHMSFRILLQAVMTYAGACVFFVVMGIGSIQARRWARSLMLAFSWLWLIGGAFGILVYAFMLPRALRHSGGPEIPQNVALVITIVMLVFMFAIFVVLPLIMMMFYRIASVKATCERRDPAARWTDRLPLPVLVLFIMLAVGAPSFLLLAVTMPYLAFFGRFLTGWMGVAACLVLAVWWAWLAWGTYRLRMSAWWATIISMVLFGVSSLLTFLRGDVARMYAAMGMPAEQSAVSAAMLQNPVMSVVMALGIVVVLIFLIYVRKYYTAARL